MNDDWPNPSFDVLPGPIMKVMRKLPGIDCGNQPPFNSTNPACMQPISWIDVNGVYHDGLPAGAVAPMEYAKAYIPFGVDDTKRLVLIVRDNTLRVQYSDLDLGITVASFSFDLTPYDYTGGLVGLHTAGHQAEFQDFRIAPLSGPDAVTTFCNGGLCDTRTGICQTTPTFNPTSYTGDVAAAGICPGPVGGSTVTIDTTDISQFTFIDQAPLSEPCAWGADATGLSQTSNAWGNYPGDNISLGCIALIGSALYTDFMVEVTATHDDDDVWGFVFGYDPFATPSPHFVAMVNNDKWPDPPADGVRGPFSKIVATNGKSFENLENITTATNPYDTLSYNDYLGRFVIDGESRLDVPGEYTRTYPFKVDAVWPDRRITLIVKDGEARIMVMAPDGTDSGAPVNNFRQPTQYISTWTSNLVAAGYTGGRIGLFLNAHQATFTDLKVTDLSTTMPTGYCNGALGATCTATGVCAAVAAPDVCEQPVGATVVDMTTLTPWDFVQDDNLNDDCEWIIEDRGNGPFLTQTSNANAGLELVGCNAIYKSTDFTDFIMQMDVDNWDNDGMGMIFGYVDPFDHFRIHKRIDSWPNPVADEVDGPNFKVSKRIAQYPCISGMNSTTACFQAVAYADFNGVFHQAMPADSITPWQYARTYVDYEITRGSASTRMVLIVKNNQLRTYFTTPTLPAKVVAIQAFDLAAWDYKGGKVGIHMVAHQAQITGLQLASLTGAGAATSFCSEGGTCNTVTGLCE